MNQVARQPEIPVTTLTPMEMLSRAIEKGIDGDQLEKLLDLQQRWESDQARKAYVQAMAEFKSEPLRVSKDRRVSHRGGSYAHASLAAVVDAVVAGLSKHGLSHRWETSQDGNVITVSCVITHELGHSERTTLSAGPDESGSKNSIQAVGSTVTYLQRYTLMAATGLAAHDMDDDGGSADEEKITEQQAADLQSMIDEVGANKDAFLRVLKVDSLSNLKASKYQGAVERLEAKRVSK